MKLGIIGTRSKHEEYFTKAVTSLFPDGRIRISHIWGDDDLSRLDEIISKGVIPKTVSTPKD